MDLRESESMTSMHSQGNGSLININLFAEFICYDVQYIHDIYIKLGLNVARLK